MWLLLYQNRGVAFLAAIAVGAVIGAMYDVFRIIRVVFTGGRIRLFFEDVLFCVMAALVFTVFMFNATMGVVRMFVAVGALFGFFAYRFTLGLFTVRAARAVKAWLTPPLKRAKLYMSKRRKQFFATRATRLQAKRVRRFAKKGFVK